MNNIPGIVPDKGHIFYPVGYHLHKKIFLHFSTNLCVLQTLIKTKLKQKNIFSLSPPNFLGGFRGLKRPNGQIIRVYKQVLLLRS